MPPRYTLSTTIAVGQSQSTSGVYLYEGTLNAIIITGSVLTGSLVSFLVSNDDVTYYPLLETTGTDFSITASAARSYLFADEKLGAWNYIKPRLGTSLSAVNQATYPLTIQFVYNTK